MDDAWDWVQEELKKIQDEIPVNSDMMQVVDAISVADFWKRRYDEELMLWERKLETKEDEKRALKEKAQTHEQAIKELEWKFQELERRWEQEKVLMDDKLRSKEAAVTLEKTQLQWEARLQALEQENKALKNEVGAASGVSVSSVPGVVSSSAIEAVRRQMEQHLREREEILKKNEEETKRRLEQLEKEKRDVAAAMAEREKSLAQERGKWTVLENELGAMSQQMKQQLSNLKNREEEHFVILEDLARGFAHRVRNYLGIISGTMQLALANYTMEPELGEQLKVVDQNVQDMLQSIEEFLALARIPPMSLQDLSLNQLLDDALNPLQEKMRQQNIGCVRNFDVRIPAVKCDQKLMTDCLRHLLENAIEAMPQGGQLSAATSFLKDQGVVSLTIADTGSGIPENHIRKVYQPYFTSKKNHKGLGLTIAKRVVDLHRGTLSMETARGKGTTITIQLFLGA